MSSQDIYPQWRLVWAAAALLSDTVYLDLKHMLSRERFPHVAGVSILTRNHFILQISYISQFFVNWSFGLSLPQFHDQQQRKHEFDVLVLNRLPSQKHVMSSETYDSAGPDSLRPVLSGSGSRLPSLSRIVTEIFKIKSVEFFLLSEQFTQHF